jgi:NAD(P)-dependent dehydrogenase (short-subunit alcohol dehydrogenase family)
MKFESGPPADAGVAQGLASLKREGGSVLVVGAASGAQHDACHRFLEGDDARVFVDTDGPVRDDETAVEVIERPVPTRSSAAAGTPGGAADIRSLAADLATGMRDRGEDSETLRVCFDSLRPLVDAADLPSLISALASVRSTARNVGAVVHFHLPAMPEAVPSALFDAVDAVVEVRRQSGTTHQRWRFPGETETTEWVEV